MSRTVRNKIDQEYDLCDAQIGPRTQAAPSADAEDAFVLIPNEEAISGAQEKKKPTSKSVSPEQKAIGTAKSAVAKTIRDSLHLPPSAVEETSGLKTLEASALEEILGRRETTGSLEYLCKWTGKEATWHPRADLEAQLALAAAVDEFDAKTANSSLKSSFGTGSSKPSYAAAARSQSQ